MAAKKWTAKTVKREAVNEENFILKDLHWSPWTLAMKPKPDTRASEPGWSTTSLTVLPSSTLSQPDLFKGDTDRPTLYEMAIEDSKKRQQVPVYHTVTKGFDKTCWDTYLLRGFNIKWQLKKSLKKGQKLYVRKAPLSLPMKVKGQRKEVSAVEELRSLMKASYDYAWNKQPARKTEISFIDGEEI